MNSTLSALIRSVAITVVISIIVGLAALYTGHSFILWAVVAFASQFILFYLFNTALEYKSARDMRTIVLNEQRILAQNTMAVECASCKKQNDVIVSTQTENRFTCGHCNTKNSVYLFAETAVVTEPMYETEPIPNTASTNGN